VDRSRRYFLADLDSFPSEDGYRYEIIQGELIVTPSPGRPHGAVATRLSNLLRTTLTETQWAYIGQPINLEIESKETTYHCEPDLSIFDRPMGEIVDDESIFPVIVIEIVSPGNPNNDYVRKVGAYAALGIPEYWIVDPRNRAITLLTLENAAYRQIDRSMLLPNVDLSPDELFAGLP
jgi:Uma2 family endonuclease